MWLIGDVVMFLCLVRVQGILGVQFVGVIFNNNLHSNPGWENDSGTSWGRHGKSKWKSLVGFEEGSCNTEAMKHP